MNYQAEESRYNRMEYRRCGRSGLKLPALSFGIWHNFGESASHDNCRKMLCGAFDLGITHFDAANNYGPPPGYAETTLGKVMKQELAAYRDELIVSTKAGYYMWPGPYGEWGSKKSLLASLDQSLARLQLDYVDVFYHHRPDPETPLEETMEALAQAVRSGKALYVGISNYSADQAEQAADILAGMGVRLLINQVRYSMYNRIFEDGQAFFIDRGLGVIAFCPLAEGLLTSKYFKGVPIDSRAGGDSIFLREESAKGIYVEKARQLDKIAQKRGQSLAQMALAWALNNPAISSLCVGASRLQQLQENVAALEHPEFDQTELVQIEAILSGMDPFFR